MKYWYLKDADIFGPAEPADIVKDLGDYTDALVCPQPHSADEDFWKEMSFYKEDFGALLAAKNNANPSLVASDFIPTEDSPAAFESAAKSFEQGPKVAQNQPAPVVEGEDILQELLSPEPLPITEITQAPAGTVSDMDIEDEAEGTLFIPKASTKAVVIQKADEQEQSAPAAAQPQSSAENPKIKPLEEEEITAVFGEAAPVKQIAPEGKPTQVEQPVKAQPQPAKEEVKTQGPLPAATAKVLPVQAQKEQEQDLESVAEVKINVEDIEETFSDVKTVRIVSAELQETPSIIDKAQAANAQPKVAEQAAQNSKEKSFFSSMKDEQPEGDEVVDNDSQSPFPFADENSPIVDDEDINTDPFLQIDSKLLVSDETAEKSVKPQKEGAAAKEEKMKKGENFFTSIPTVSGKIISSYEAPPSKSKNDTVIILLGFMVFFVAIALFMAKFMDKPNQAEQPAPIPAVEQLEEERPPLPIVSHKEYAPSQDTIPMIEVTDSTDSVPVVETPKEDVKTRAQEVVKKYLLDSKRGTVSEYFDKTYGEDYQKRWKSSPLYGDTYVVEFVASKVRKEPIVYLFRVDNKRGVVTGGLNNITLDLLQN